MLTEGELAPDFTLQADDAESVTLSALRGRRVVLYFYPKDDTPGCTIQACDFRDSLPRFDGIDAVILGVSADTVESHVKFKSKYDLNFPLLADVDHSVSEAYGVWQKGLLFGKKRMGIVRSTFLVDEEGRLQSAWYNVKAKGHAEAVAEAFGLQV